MRKTTRYHIETDAKRLIMFESQHKFPLETGGILIGFLKSGSVVITHASDPGPKAIHTHSSFKRDGDYTQLYLENIIHDSGNIVDYIGEWHSHPIQRGPSDQDVHSMRWISVNSNYSLSTPLMGLCILIGGNWTFQLHIFLKGKLVQLKETL